MAPCALVLAGLGCASGKAASRTAPRSSAPPAAARSLDLPGLTREALFDGVKGSFEGKFGKNLARSFNVAPEARSAYEVVEAHVSEDHRQRAFAVVLDTVTSVKPESLLFMALEWDLERKVKKDLYIQVAPDGEWLLGLSCEGKLDENGVYVKGTCRPEAVDPSSEEGRALLRRERDFWTKGVGRKARPPRPPIELEWERKERESKTAPPPANAVPEGGGDARPPALTAP